MQCLTEHCPNRINYDEPLLTFKKENGKILSGFQSKLSLSKTKQGLAMDLGSDKQKEWPHHHHLTSSLHFSVTDFSLTKINNYIYKYRSRQTNKI